MDSGPKEARRVQGVRVAAAREAAGCSGRVQVGLQSEAFFPLLQVAPRTLVSSIFSLLGLRGRRFRKYSWAGCFIVLSEAPAHKALLPISQPRRPAAVIPVLS